MCDQIKVAGGDYHTAVKIWVEIILGGLVLSGVIFDEILSSTKCLLLNVALSNKLKVYLMRVQSLFVPQRSSVSFSHLRKKSQLNTRSGSTYLKSIYIVYVLSQGHLNCMLYTIKNDKEASMTD